MKILVTGANGDIGEAIGRILKESFPDADICGADAAGRWPGGFIFRNMIEVPFASASGYMDRMQKLGDQFDLIIPTSEPELARFAQINDIKSRLPLIMVEPEILNTFMDKYKTFEFFAKYNLNPPKTKRLVEVKTADLPVYLKPRRGAGSRGHRIIKTDLELQAAGQNANEDWIAQEYLSGNDNEYTCALCCLDNSIRYVVLKRILQGDKSVRAEIADIPEINALLEKIVRIINLDGCINVQLKMTNDGPRVFEINPRLSSTVMMRHKLGFCDCLWWVKKFFDMPISDYHIQPAGTVVYRMSTECVVPR